MAKKNTSNPKTETAARIQRTEAYANQVRALFAMTVNQILALNKSVPKLEPGVMFSFDAQSLKMQKEVERLLRQLHSVTTMAIQNGIKLEWGQANLAADQLVKSVIGKELFSNPTFNAWTARNGAAMNKFLNRSEKGLNLSERVWKSVKQLREEMEVAITVAVGDGKSAQKMSQDVRKYLNDPDLMFRRFRYKKGEEIEYDDEGNEIGKKIIWGKKWKKRVKKPDGSYGWIDYDRDSYKTGSGVYKSSAKNAMRVARSETNIAYRRADNERWNQMDFVLGQRINLSGNHPAKDICDKLAGDYPKEFLFDGWHPQCFCYVTPITLPPEETAHLTDMMLNGEDWRAELAKLKRGREITQYPKNFKDWVEENKDKILNAHDNGTDPYFIRNNFKAINAILNPDSKDAQEQLQKEEQQRIEQVQRQAELEAKKKEAHITQISAKYGDNVLNIMKDIPGVDTTALQAAIKAGDTTLIQEEATKLRNIGKQFKIDAKTALNSAAHYGEISGAELEAAMAAGNIKEIWEKTKALQTTIAHTQADEAALSQLIPNAHEWHKQFSSADLHVVYDKVEQKLASLTGLSLQEQKKQLIKEIKYVSDPDYLKPHKLYHTWEVAENAYTKALKEVEYKIAIEELKIKLQIVEAWSANHPRSKNVANLLLAAQTSILNNEPLPTIVNKVDLAVREYQKRLAEQARRDSKKSGAFNLKDISEEDRKELLDEFINKATVEGTDSKLRPETEVAWGTLSEEERKLCTKYTQSYCYLNEPLRNMTYAGGRSNDEYNNDMPKLTKALQKVKTTRNMVVRRGVDNYYISEISKSLIDVEIGDTFIDGAFLSTACHRTKGFHQTINLIIYVPKGAEGIYAEPFTHYNDSGCYNYNSNLWNGTDKQSIGGEFEWIGQRGSRFRVVNKIGSTIYLQMIGQRYKQPL